MGPWGGFVTGLCENVEYVITPAVVVSFIGSYMGSIFGTPPAFQPVYWIFGYIIFVGLNIAGVELSFRVTLVVTLAALACLVAFWVSALPVANFSRWALNIGVGPDGTVVELPNGGGPFLPFGIGGALAALPFAVWLFLAIEQLPLAAEESVDPKTDMPKGIMAGMATLIVSAFMILWLNSSVANGSFGLSTSLEPLLDGFKAIYGDGLARLLALVAVIGLIASFHTIIYAQGRQIYSLSRAGYFPRGLSVTHGGRKTPHVAMVAGALVGLVIMLGIWFALGAEAGAAAIGGTLLNMAVFGAMLSYVMQAISFILMRKNMPHIERPYKSPFGIPGAVATIVIALVTIYFQLSDPLYRSGVIGVAVWFAVPVSPISRRSGAGTKLGALAGRGVRPLRRDSGLQELLSRHSTARSTVQDAATRRPGGCSVRFHRDHTEGVECRHLRGSDTYSPTTNRSSLEAIARLIVVGEPVMS